MSVFHNNALIGAGGGAAAADAAVATKSLRFNSGDSAYLNRTPSSSGNRKTFTFSAWVKRTVLVEGNSPNKEIFIVVGSSNTTHFQLGFRADKLYVANLDTLLRVTDAVFRDTSAWYHIVLAVDTTQSTADNRIKLYVNGSQITSFSSSSNPSQNSDTGVNHTQQHNIGKEDHYFDGYMADIYLIDGSALDPTSFGAYDDSGVWQAAVYSGTYGTNGFHLLDFENEATIGHDSSGNDNDFTANNLSDETTTLPGVNFTSSTSDHLDHPTSTDFNFTGDFTIECYVKVTAYNASGASTIAGTGSGSWSFGLTNTGKVSFGHYGVQGFFSGGASVLAGVWTHVAVARSGSSVKGFINGVEEVSTTYSTSMSNTNELYIGNDISNSSQHFNGVISNLNIVQGTALYTSNFSPPTTPLSAHANTKLLCCQSSSSTTAAAVAPGTLSADGSVTAGNFTDSGFNADVLFDVPTNGTQSDTGAGGEVSGNYATLNPETDFSYPVVLSNGNLDVSTSGLSENWTGAVATIAQKSGKWYAEFSITAKHASNHINVGINPLNRQNTYLQGDSTSGHYYTSDGKFWNANSLGGSYASYDVGDVIGVAVDMDTNNDVKFYKNGSLQGTVSLNSNITTYGFQFAVAPYAQGGSTVTSLSCNFGARAFTYSAPSGYKALCTTNLPTPTIADGSDYFNSLLYTGTGSQQDISGLNFSPDWLWIKRRDAAQNHILVDVIRGSNKELNSNATSAEGTFNRNVTAFNSDGFRVLDGNPNVNNGTFVAWCWDAGSSTVSNTDGSITSQVRANQAAGFSILTFTNTTSDSTVGHGLNAKPDMIIWKKRNGTSHWGIYHSSLAATKVLYLNLTNAAATGSEFWNNTEPTSSVITTKGEPDSFGSAGDTVMYVFASVAGFSEVGSFINPSSTGSAFVFCGFRPAFLLAKCAENISSSSGTGDWIIKDSARSPFNDPSDGNTLVANVDNAEDGYYNAGQAAIDFLSNGFKIRHNNTSPLGDPGRRYVFIAFAENPFQANGGLAR